MAFFSFSLNPLEAGVIAQEGRASIQSQSKLITKQKGFHRFHNAFNGEGGVFYIKQGQKGVTEGRGWWVGIQRI